MVLNEDLEKEVEISEEDIRAGKEDIVKAKLGNEAQDIDLSSVSDEDLEKAVTEEDKEELLKQATGVENLKTDNLSDEEMDALIGKVAESKDIDEIIECMSLVESSESDIIEALRVHSGLKIEEAQEIYQDKLQEKEVLPIDYIYALMHEDQEGDYNLTENEPEGALDCLEPVKESVDYTGEAIAEEDAEFFETPITPAKPVEVTVDENAHDACAALEAQKGETL